MFIFELGLFVFICTLLLAFENVSTFHLDTVKTALKGTSI